MAVQPPDKAGQVAILEVPTRSIPLADDADLEALAGCHDAVRMRDFDDALARTLLGTERGLVMTEHDRERTAHREAGHALVGMLSRHADPVRRISIIPRGTALGVTYAALDAERYSYTREELLTKIRLALGGRAAEQLVYGDVTTGAESDIDRLTVIARQMVGRWGHGRRGRRGRGHPLRLAVMLPGSTGTRRRASEPALPTETGRARIRPSPFV